MNGTNDKELLFSLLCDLLLLLGNCGVKRAKFGIKKFFAIVSTPKLNKNYNSCDFRYCAPHICDAGPNVYWQRSQ